MKKNFKKYKVVLILTVVFIISIFLFIMSEADGGEPGSETDPIVTLSYVEKRIEQIKYYVDSNFKPELDRLTLELEKKDKLIDELKDKVDKALTFKVVELSKGQILLADEGAELIIRSGKSVAVYGELGGLSDITSAKDLKKGEAIEVNHMLIASRGDGRGVKAESGVFLIIKGGYTLK